MKTDTEKETTHTERAVRRQKEARRRVGNHGKSSGKKKKEERDGKVEVDRQEARIGAERLDTSQHGKEEIRLTRIKDINERTATRAGDLGHVEGGAPVVIGERTLDKKDTHGWGPQGGRPWRNGGAGLGTTAWGRGGVWFWGRAVLEEENSGQCWGSWWILKEGDAPGRGEPKRKPHQFHPHSPCPTPLPCSVARMH